MYRAVGASYRRLLLDADTVCSIASVGHHGQDTLRTSGDPDASTGAGRFPPRLNRTGIATPAFAVFSRPALSTGSKKPLHGYRTASDTLFVAAV